MTITEQKQTAIENVALCLKTLIGNRSIRETASDSNVAASYISGILKRKYLPSAEILKRLSLPEAKPQNGVTLEDLMMAAGYINHKMYIPKENTKRRVEMDETTKETKTCKTCFYVTFRWHDTETFCTNICYAKSKADVETKYGNYSDVYIRRASTYEVNTAERKRMPMIEI